MSEVPGFVMFQFGIIDDMKRTTDENEYSGPFNALLNSFFPASEYYQIVPHSQLKCIAGSIDFTVINLVGDKNPILIVQVMSDVAYKTPSLRKAADERMHESILDASTRDGRDADICDTMP